MWKKFGENVFKEKVFEMFLGENHRKNKDLYKSSKLHNGIIIRFYTV